MKRHQHNGIAYYTFESLDRFDELIHAITTRHGGISVGRYSSLNLTTGTGDDPAAVGENLERVCAALNLRRADLVSPNQRHTANVRRIEQTDRGQVYTGYDVFVTNQPGVPILLRYADCTPVLIYDPVHRATAVVHSGWRGTVQGATRAAVEALGREYGSRPADLVAGIGPSIGPCCYEIGEEVANAVRAAFDRADELLPVRSGKSRRHLDLWAANQRWLAEAGVRQIEVAGLCTACRVDEFYSYRIEGKTGHFGAVMALRHD